jgi:membrane-bound ClpP family serine protease
MASKKIKGKVIRILDKRTVVINLGSKNRISNDSVFHILGDPEDIVDPETQETLGTVRVSKSRVRASQVFDRFTVATTAWTNTYWPQLSHFLSGYSGISGKPTIEEVDEGELNVDVHDIHPWKAKSESPVKVGDEVEVVVDIEEAKKEPSSAKKSE